MSRAPVIPGLLDPVLTRPGTDEVIQPRRPHQLHRPQNPAPSRQAAERVEPRLGTLQWRVLRLLRVHGPSTQHHIIERYRALFGPVAESTVRTRVSELVASGWVYDTGRTETLPHGREATVWAAKDELCAL